MKRKAVTKKLLSAALCLGMVLAPMNIPPAAVTTYAEPADATAAKYINLEQATKDFYVGSDWAFANATLAEDGTKAVISATSFGTQLWGLQYNIMNLSLMNNTAYNIEFDITSSIDKKVFVKINDTDAGFYSETLTLKANEPHHFKQEALECGTWAAKNIIFGLGADGEENLPSGTITIDNLSITEAGGSSVADPIGKEYDFTAVSENAAKDFADPGQDKEGYDLVWADEFDGNYGDANVDPVTGLNLDNWAPQLGDGTTDCGNPGWGNKELQAYTGAAKNIGVNEDFNNDNNGEGLLRITAAYEPNGYVYGTESPKKYTSARLRTTKPDEALFNTTYGYVEARISLPETKGAWPAFWMLPESTTIYGNWPVSGEIDIMETVGAGVGGKQACGTLHWGAPEHVYKGSGYVDLSSNFSHFHTYAIDWEPGKITWYYDGQEINSLANWKGQIPGTSDALSFDAPFDEPFYMLLNLAVDSGQFGGTNNKAAFEDAINMYVDYVRVYHRQGGYAPEAERAASGDAATDWADYAGVNQIADVTADSIDTASSGAMNDASYDTAKWALSNQDDGQGATLEKITDASGKTWAKVGIANAGSNDYSVQLIGHYDAKEGYVYKVSFDAYADGGMVGKTVNCDSKEWKSWGTYGIQSFELTDAPQTTSFLFSQAEDFDKCRIEFNVGAQATGHVYVGNVKVEIVDPASLDQEADSRKPLSDGNLIYNSTFDQGEHHTGYWRATEGTTFEVPRYTTTALKDTDLSVLDVAAGETHYYERRAQISSDAVPTVYQPDLKMAADGYSVSFDLYSAKDTNVTVSICEATENGLGKTLVSTTAPYSKESGVKTYTWNFATSQDIDNAALVFTFDQGASVQLDNVTMIGASQGTPIDETPVTPDDEWQGNTAGAGGAAITLEKVDDTWVASGVTSDAGAWYTPQIGSNDFDIAGGKSYTLTFKVKMDANTNGTFEYIVQEDGGGWAVVQDVVTVDTAELGQADADGYYTYTKQVDAASSIANVHVNFGLGHSQANNGTFSFKDVNFTLNKGGNGTGNDDDTITKMPESFAITYELDGGINAQDNPLAYTSGSDSIALAAPVKDGYTFLGWTLGKAGTDYITSIAAGQTGSITLYANWKNNAATVDPKPGNDPSNSGTDKNDPAKGTNNSASGSQKPGPGAETPSAETKALVDQITLTGISKKIAAGKKITLTASVAPANAADQTLTWKSSNTKYATVSDKGVVTTKKAGAGKSVTITATANDGSGKTATYQIKIMKKAVQKITLKASKKTVKAGKSVTIKATVNPSGKNTNKVLSWKSSNTKYATVNDKGVVKTKKAGKGKTVKITATATDGSNTKKTITIKIK
ncbi:MAG: family 16 glycosylhydrolase [Lachnospiraceae bacterium]|nr:family 16 glycosylhydrolase [Lachnospiraceae bacterium]